MSGLVKNKVTELLVSLVFLLLLNNQARPHTSSLFSFAVVLQIVCNIDFEIRLTLRVSYQSRAMGRCGHKTSKAIEALLKYETLPIQLR